MVSEISPERRYVCDSALTVDRTRDDGKSWRKLTKGLPQKNAYTQVLRHAATVNHRNNDGVYLGTTSGSIFLPEWRQFLESFGRAPASDHVAGGGPGVSACPSSI